MLMKMAVSSNNLPKTNSGNRDSRPCQLFEASSAHCSRFFDYLSKFRVPL
jgi:hypothetical protein